MREAVEIVIYAEREHASSEAVGIYGASTIPVAIQRQARAIVDAAEAHWVALCRHRDNECLSDDFMLGQDEERKYQKLRALERGEES